MLSGVKVYRGLSARRSPLQESPIRGYTCRMTKQALELLQKALALPEADRAALAGSLLESLDQVVDADAELAWKTEITRRIADLDSGKAKTVPWEELRGKLAARLANGK